MPKINFVLKNFRLIAIVGNILFILWISYNGIDEGFRGTPLQIVSYISLLVLLMLNITLLIYLGNKIK